MMIAYPLAARRSMTAGAGALPVGRLIAIAAGIAAIGGASATTLSGDLALITVVVAASERRHAAMLMAVGMACGLVCYGAMMVPLAIGIAVQRRIGARALLLAPAMAGVTMLATVAVPVADARASIGLWAVLPDPGLYGLLVAIALGTLGWLAAALTARPLAGRDLATAATIAALAFALVIPQTAMAVPVALSILARDRRVPGLATAAALLGAFSQPIPATLALIAALILVARPFLQPAANDNPALAAV